MRSKESINIYTYVNGRLPLTVSRRCSSRVTVTKSGHQKQQQNRKEIKVICQSQQEIVIMTTRTTHLKTWAIEPTAPLFLDTNTHAHSHARIIPVWDTLETRLLPVKCPLVPQPLPVTRHTRNLLAVEIRYWVHKPLRSIQYSY